MKSIKKDSFHLHMPWIFWVPYVFKICSWHHKLSHLFSIHALFHCTSVHCWIVDKSRFLSLEKFESLWLVPLRCCELATLGAFFFFDLHWQHIYDQIWIVKCLAAKYWFNQKVSSSDSFKIILVYLYPFLLGFFPLVF